jgi:hypothetical protein
MSSRFVHVGKEAKGAARFLLASLPALGAVFTALAITGDIVGRMARNHPVASFGAFGCAALAVFLGAVAAFGLPEGSSAERIAIHTGIAVLGGGLVVGVYAGVRTWGDRTEPSIKVRATNGSMVAVTVRDTGLRSSDHVGVEVDQLVRVDGGADGRVAWRVGQPLYSASLGPDVAGKVDHTFTLALPAGDFDDLGAQAWVGNGPKPCNTKGNTTGCVRVHIPRRQEWPQLAVGWETFVRAPRLLVTLRARNLTSRPVRSVILRVYGVAAGQPDRTLAEWSLAPDGDGRFDRRLAVVVGHAYSDVCIVASTSRRDPQCPAPVEAGTVWTRLAVPAP